MSKLLTQNNNHVFVSGQTRSGKTYFTARALLQLNRPVIIFNLQDEDLPSKFLVINQKEATMPQIIDSLKSKIRIDLRLPDTAKSTNETIGYVVEKLMLAGFSENNPIYIVFDECHLLEQRGLKAAIQAATRGLKRGCRCIFVTQRPALSDKTLYTQSAEQYIFYLPKTEKEYLKNKGLDYDQCFEQWEKLGKYSYLFYDGFILEGRESI